MPLTIAAVNPKGGTGKTTIAAHLAVASCRSGYPTKLLDTDPQGTAFNWSDTEDTDGVPVVHLGDSSLEDDLPRVGESFELVVIDGAPRMGSLTASAVRVSDLVVIPVQPNGRRHLER